MRVDRTGILADDTELPNEAGERTPAPWDLERSMTPEVSCELANRWLSRAIDEEISPREESLLEGHLDTCPDCRAARERLFDDVALIESSFAGITSELDELLGQDLAARAVETPTTPVRVDRLVPARWTAALAASAVLALVLFVGFGTKNAAAPSRVAVDFGAGVVRSIDGGEQHLAGEGTLDWQADETLRLPSGSEAWFSFEDGSIARGGEGSQWRLIESSEDRLELELLAGRAAFRIAKREAPFRVLTPHAEVTVLGTEFGVIHEQGRTIVTVSEGTVSVRRRYESHEPYILEKNGRLELTRRGVLLDVHSHLRERRRPQLEEEELKAEDPDADRSVAPARVEEETSTPKRSEPLDVPVGSRKSEDSDEE